jgi:hypothetical protein
VAHPHWKTAQPRSRQGGPHGGTVGDPRGCGGGQGGCHGGAIDGPHGCGGGHGGQER